MKLWYGCTAGGLSTGKDGADNQVRDEVAAPLVVGNGDRQAGDAAPKFLSSCSCSLEIVGDHVWWVYKSKPSSEFPELYPLNFASKAKLKVLTSISPSLVFHGREELYYPWFVGFVADLPKLPLNACFVKDLKDQIVKTKCLQVLSVQVATGVVEPPHPHPFCKDVSGLGADWEA